MARVRVVVIGPSTRFVEGKRVAATTFALVKGGVGGVVAVLRQAGASVGGVGRMLRTGHPHGAAALVAPGYGAALFNSNLCRRKTVGSVRDGRRHGRPHANAYPNASVGAGLPGAVCCARRGVSVDRSLAAVPPPTSARQNKDNKYDYNPSRSVHR